jgi:hypothetical protein
MKTIITEKKLRTMIRNCILQEVSERSSRDISIESLQLLIYEELGRNMRSPPAEETMYDWRHMKGVHAEVSPNPSQGGWNVKISTEDGSASLPMRFFSDETSAKFWAREQVEKIRNKMMAKDPQVGRQYLEHDDEI